MSRRTSIADRGKTPFGRWLAVLLLVLLPLQMSFAAMHDYVGHHLQSSGIEAVLVHTHDHTSMDHVPANALDSAAPEHQTNAADPDDDDDVGHVHLGHIHFVSSAFALLSSPLSAAPLPLASLPYPSIPPRRLDRPPLSARL